MAEIGIILGVQEHAIIQDLGVVVVCAVGVSILFNRLKLPSILGYILAGFLIGPNLFPGGGLITDFAAIQSLAELGVIFLIFYIGLEFDLKKLQKLFMPSLASLVIQTIVMMVVGLQAAVLLKWGVMDGLFLGALLSISSSMVTLSVLQERGELKLPRAQLAIGILIFEDILAVLLLVLLSGVSVTNSLEIDLVWLTTAGVAVFVVCVYYIGKLLAPKLLEILEDLGKLDLVVLTSVGFSLGLGLLGQRFDFSLALGAFLAGSILSQTRLVRQIEHSIEPMRSLFGAVFFVSIGMLVDPSAILDNWLPVVALSLLVIVGKVASCWLGLFLSGENPGSSFRAAVVKSQIGEFSFIIAALGMHLGVTDAPIMNVAVGVALITILTTPILASRSVALYDKLQQATPAPILLAGSFYTRILEQVKQSLDRNAIFKLVRRPILQILGYLFLLSGVMLISSLLANFVQKQETLADYEWLLQGGIWLLAAAASLPFIISILRNINAVILLTIEGALPSHIVEQYLRGRLSNLINLLMTALVVLPVGGLYFSLAANFFPKGSMLIVFVLILVLASILFWKRMIQVNSRLELMFMESVTEELQSQSEERREQAMKEIAQKYPWSVQVSSLVIPDTCSGRTIQDLQLRERAGVSIVGVGREDEVFYDPSPNTPLFQGDRLYVFGGEGQTQKAREVMAKFGKGLTRPAQRRTFAIETIYLQPNSELVGESLAGADLRRKYGVNVLGIQRGDERLTAPSAEEILKQGDVLYVIGNKGSIEQLQHVEEE